MPSAICPICNRSIALTKASYFKSHRAIPGRFGRGPYCKGSGNMPVGPKAQQAPLHYTIQSIEFGGTVTLVAPNGEQVGYAMTAIRRDRARGPLKVGDKVERDPDRLDPFIRVGDFV
jgi:hypothetical protein